VGKAKPELSKLVLFLVMFDETEEPPLANDPLKNPSSFGEGQAQSGVIAKQERIESEQAGRDIGFERALTDWIIKHRSNPLKKPQRETQRREISSS
jgi:hypothetical protein